MVIYIRVRFFFVFLLLILCFRKCVEIYAILTVVTAICSTFTRTGYTFSYYFYCFFFIDRTMSSVVSTTALEQMAYATGGYYALLILRNRADGMALENKHFYKQMIHHAFLQWISFSGNPILVSGLVSIASIPNALPVPRGPADPSRTIAMHTRGW